MDKQVDLKSIREAERLDELKKFVRISLGWMSIPLFLIFWLADIIYAPDLKYEFLGVRLVNVTVNFIVYRLIWNIDNLKSALRLSLLFTASNSFAISLMMLFTEGLASPYYAGLNMVFVGCISFLPWSKKYLPWASFSIWGPVIVFGLPSIDKSNFEQIILNSFFISGTAVISLVIRHFTEKLREQDVQSKYELAMEIKNRDTIIDRQTKEAVQLNELTRQFSPQIIHAIKGGQLDLHTDIHERNICSIFIDIVNSTEKVVEIDKVKLNKVISMFIHDTMGILLKYDITVDKFLGDGILAFSNDPLEQENYVVRVLNAAVEILTNIENNQNFYVENWGAQLEIRIGVAAGAASVGFYGNDKTLKSYTAIGRVVNLASRLCSAAEPNEILISDAVKEKATGQGYEVHSRKDVELKGFSENVKVYSVNPNSVSHHGGKVVYCPNGHGILHLEVKNGIFVFRCRTCGHVLSGEDELELLFGT